MRIEQWNAWSSMWAWYNFYCSLSESNVFSHVCLLLCLLTGGIPIQGPWRPPPTITPLLTIRGPLDLFKLVQFGPDHTRHTRSPTPPLPRHIQTCSLCSPYFHRQACGWHSTEMPSCYLKVSRYLYDNNMLWIATSINYTFGSYINIVDVLTGLLLAHVTFVVICFGGNYTKSASISWWARLWYQKKVILQSYSVNSQKQ